MSGKTKEELYSAVASTMQEVNEILAKSGYAMDKAEDEFAEPAPEEAAPAPEMGAEAAPEEEFSEPAPEEGMGEEGAEGGDDMDEMRAHAQELSDEELEMMLEILMSEKETRGAAAPEEGMGEEPAPAPEAAPAPEEDEFAEKSMKEDYSKMAKSIDAIASVVEKLNKSVEDIKKRPTQTPRPAATNRTQVLSKSTESKSAPQRLNKSDTINYCLGQIGQHKAVNSGVIADLNLARTDSELHEIQDGLAKQGFEFPKV